MTNLERANAAEECLNHFIVLTGPGITLREATGDLIANIGHYCQSSGLNFIDIVETAIGHWTLEQTDEKSIDALPDVTITINQEKHSM